MRDPYRTLPRSSFIDSTLNHVASAKLLWAQYECEASRSWLDYCYCQPVGEVVPPQFNDHQIVAKVERYGGDGIGYNGGGVRCGLVGEYIVKGIGTNALAGERTAIWHRYGGATLKEGIREIIWGEIYNVALPHGAVRTEAIMSTGSKIPLQYLDTQGRKECERVLLLRRPFLRPAHYMCAPFFRSNHSTRSMVSDADRTKNSIKSFESALRLSLGTSDCLLLPELLELMFDRFAVQISTARAKRLIHGALSPSNITLDGRFLDFGMTSSTSDHGRIIVAGRMADAWTQERMLLAAIPDVVFYARKYHNHIINTSELTDHLTKRFISILRACYERELLKLSGVPSKVIMNLDPITSHRIHHVFTEISAIGNQEPFKLLCPCPHYKPEMPKTMGKYNLGECIKLFWKYRGNQRNIEELNRIIQNQELAARFFTSMEELYQLSLVMYNQQENAHMSNYCNLNAYRINCNIPGLYYHELNKRIDCCEDIESGVANLISTALAETIDLVKEPTQDTLTVRIQTGETISASATEGMQLGGQEINNSALFDVLNENF